MMKGDKRMKKNLFTVLILVLAMLLSTAVAGNAESLSETVSGKINLWTHDVVIMDQAGEQITYPMNVTFEPKAPVEMTRLPVADSLKDEICIVNVTREGVGNVMIAISPANRGLHYNLNDYTDEMLDEYIKSVAEASFAEGSYTAEVRKSEGGNTYVSIGDEYQETLSTIYDDFTMEFYIMRDLENGQMVALTDEDHAFVIEMFQSVWTEDAEIPAMDTAVTLNVSEKFLAGLNVRDAASIAKMINRISFQAHGEKNHIRLAMKSGDEDVVNFDMSLREDGSVLVQSNIIGDKGIIISNEFIKNAAAKKANSPAEVNAQAMTELIGNVDFTKTAEAALSAASMSMNANGAIVFTVSAEGAKNVLNAFGEDLKASGIVAKIASLAGAGEMTNEDAGSLVDLILGMTSGFFQEKDFMEVTMMSDESGAQVVSGTIKYNGTSYTYDEATNDIQTVVVPSTVSFATVINMTNDGMKIDFAEYTGPDGGDTLQTVLLNAEIFMATGEYNAELTIGSTVAGEMVPSFAVEAKNVKTTDNLGSMDTTQVTVKGADGNGNLNEVFNVVNLLTGTGADNIQALMVNVPGYEDPVIVLRTAQVFADNVAVTEPAEIIRIEDITPEMSKEFSQNFNDKIESLFTEDTEVSATEAAAQ